MLRASKKKGQAQHSFKCTVARLCGCSYFLMSCHLSPAAPQASGWDATSTMQRIVGQRGGNIVIRADAAGEAVLRRTDVSVTSGQENSALDIYLLIIY